MTFKIDEFVRKVTIIRVVDGDTIDFEIDLGWDIKMKERCRLLGVDTPEVRGPERPQGLEYKEFVIQWLFDHINLRIHCRKYESGKYGRSLVEVYGDNINPTTKEVVESDVCLNDVLIRRMQNDIR